MQEAMNNTAGALKMGRTSRRFWVQYAALLVKNTKLPKWPLLAQATSNGISIHGYFCI